MFLTWVIFITLMVGSLGVQNVTENMSIVIELTKKQALSGVINAYISWSRVQKVEFLKLCSRNFISLRITHTRSLLKFNGPVNQQIFVVDWDCEGSKDLLNQAENDGLFRYPTRWIILGDHENTISELRKYFFGIDSKVYVVVNNGNEYSIKMPYKFAKNDTNFIEDNVATWKNGNLLYYNDVTVPQNRSDLMGTRFKLSYTFLDPDSLNHIYDRKNIHIDTIGKSNYVLINQVIETLNVTVAPPVFYKSRGYKKNGTDKYDYMMGELQRNEIDIAGTSSAMTLERVDFQYFLAPAFYSDLIFAFRAPLLSHVANIFNVAFDPYVWYASFAMAFTVLPVLYLIVRFEWAAIGYVNSAKVLRDDIFDVSLNTLEVVTQQGTETEPRSMSGRSVLMISLISFMFLYTAFGANIVAVLQSTSESIQTIEDLYTSGIKIGSEDTNYARAFFAAETHPVRRALRDEKLEYLSLEKGMERMKNEFFAFHSETSTIYKIAKETFPPAEICKLRQIVFFKSISKPYFSVPLNSTYKELLKYKLELFHSYGIISREQRIMFTEKPKCLSQGSFGTVGIVECHAVYVIFGIGIGCSLGLFLLEILWKKIKTRNLAGTGN